MDRRRLLTVAAVVGGTAAAGTVLAACSSDTTTPGAQQPAPSASTQAPAAPAPGATTASGVIVAAASVPVGGGAVAVVGDQKVIVTQPEAGVFKGFDAVCTHEACTVAGVEDGAILCRCHNSRFDVTTGDVLQGPAPAPLATVAVAQQGDEIVFA
jgi:Rieske Fe-S protein